MEVSKKIIDWAKEAKESGSHHRDHRQQLHGRAAEHAGAGGAVFHGARHQDGTVLTARPPTFSRTRPQPTRTTTPA